MSQIVGVTVSWEVTVQARQYEPVKVYAEMSADIHSGDNPEATISELNGRVKALLAQELAVLSFPAAKSMARELLNDDRVPLDDDF